MVPSTDTDLCNSKVTVDLKVNKPVLQKGCRKIEVLELRKLLAHWNIYTGACSHIFDELLDSAVRKFQRRVFLKEDGIVGPLTWQALYTGSPINMPELKIGAFGDEVTQLQLALKAAGIEVGVVDGVFGPLTEKAVRNFQRRKGLVVDGIVGLSTWRTLSKVCR